MPNAVTAKQTPLPVSVLKSRTVEGSMLPNETSIERCNENMETAASATDMLLIVIKSGELDFLLLYKFLIAKVTLTNV